MRCGLVVNVIYQARPCLGQSSCNSCELSSILDTCSKMYLSSVITRSGEHCYVLAALQNVRVGYWNLTSNQKVVWKKNPDSFFNESCFEVTGHNQPPPTRKALCWLGWSRFQLARRTVYIPLAQKILKNGVEEAGTFNNTAKASILMIG